MRRFLPAVPLPGTLPGVALLGAALLLAGPASAQTTNTVGGLGGTRAQGPIRPANPEGRDTGPRRPPPGLPGLAANRAPEPIPAEGNPAAMSPSAALFDAINRGDLAAARDAMARGADLNARNRLGLTAVDAAVDQGRNDIAFYLLSARGSAGSGPTSAPQEPATGRGGRNARGRLAPETAEGPSPGQARAAGEDPRRPLPRRLNDPPVGVEAPVAASGGTARPRLFSNDGGAARPDVGFLGFDAGRPAGAEPVPDPRARRGRG